MCGPVQHIDAHTLLDELLQCLTTMQCGAVCYASVVLVLLSVVVCAMGVLCALFVCCVCDHVLITEGAVKYRSSIDDGFMHRYREHSHKSLKQFKFHQIDRFK